MSSSPPSPPSPPSTPPRGTAASAEAQGKGVVRPKKKRPALTRGEGSRFLGFGSEDKGPAGGRRRRRKSKRKSHKKSHKKKHRTKRRRKSRKKKSKRRRRR